MKMAIRQFDGLAVRNPEDALLRSAGLNACLSKSMLEAVTNRWKAARTTAMFAAFRDAIFAATGMTNGKPWG